MTLETIKLLLKSPVFEDILLAATFIKVGKYSFEDCKKIADNQLSDNLLSFYRVKDASHSANGIQVTGKLFIDNSYSGTLYIQNVPLYANIKI